MTDIMHPVGDFTLTFRNGEKFVIFKVRETAPSRSFGAGYELIYSVIIDPPMADGFLDYLFSYSELTYKNFPSEEVIIGWNVWLKAGCTFFSNHLAKKWPPECRRIGDNQFEVTIQYAPLYILNFQILPIQVNRKTSRHTEVWAYPSNPDSAADKYARWLDPNYMSQEEKVYHLFINVDTHGSGTQQGEVRGVDIIEPSLTWTERWAWGPQDILWSQIGDVYVDYFDTLASLTARTNDRKFRGFDVGTVLFTGASGRHVQPLAWEIDYNFHYRPGFKYGEEIAGQMIEWKNDYAKGGHAILDIDTVRRDVKLSNVDGMETFRVIVPTPICIKKHQVYKMGNLQDLKTYGEEISLKDGACFGNAPLLSKLPTIGKEHSKPPVEAD